MTSLCISCFNLSYPQLPLLRIRHRLATTVLTPSNARELTIRRWLIGATCSIGHVKYLTCGVRVSYSSARPRTGESTSTSSPNRVMQLIKANGGFLTLARTGGGGVGATPPPEVFRG